MNPNDRPRDPRVPKEPSEAHFHKQISALHSIIDELRKKNEQLARQVDILVKDKKEREEKKKKKRDSSSRKRVKAATGSDASSDEGFEVVLSKKDLKAAKNQNKLPSREVVQENPSAAPRKPPQAPNGKTNPTKVQSHVGSATMEATTQGPALNREDIQTPGTSQEGMDLQEIVGSGDSSADPTPPAASVAPETNIPSATNSGNSGRKPKPVVITETNKWPQVKRQLEKLEWNYTSVKTVYLGLQVQPTSIDDHRGITKLLRDKKVQFHTWDLDEDRKLNLVIRGIGGLKEQDVKTELTKMGFHPQEVFYLKTKGGTSKLIKVLIPKNEGENFRKIGTIFGIPVTVESQKPNGSRKPCASCQYFGHSSRNCHTASRCVKCNGCHHWRDCRKSESETATCCNCGGPHAATYGGCPKNPKNIFSSYAKAAKNKDQQNTNQKQPKAPTAPKNVISGEARPNSASKPIPKPRVRTSIQGKEIHTTLQSTQKTAQNKVEEFFQTMQAQFASMMAAMMSSMAQAMQTTSSD